MSQDSLLDSAHALPGLQALVRHLQGREITGADSNPLPCVWTERLKDSAPAARRAPLVAGLLAQARSSLGRMPRAAEALGQVALAMARGGTDDLQRAEAACFVAAALNRLGEITPALTLAEEAVETALRLGALNLTARSLCQAAWANRIIGNLQPAIDQVARARTLDSTPAVAAHCDWIAAGLLRDQSRYAEALRLFDRAHACLVALGDPLEAARVEQDRAHVSLAAGEHGVGPVLERLQRTFQQAGCGLDVALCTLIRAESLLETAPVPTLGLLQSVRQQLSEQGTPFHVAQCDMYLAMTFRRLDRYAESLQAAHRARDYYLARGVRSKIVGCDITLGNSYYSLNRYDKALVQYRHAVDLSAGEERHDRTARLCINIGLIYLKQGLYSQALDQYYRALEITASRDLTTLVVACHQSLVYCYRQLGQYDQALAHLAIWRETAGRHGARSVLMCDIEQAEIHLARGETDAAIAWAERANQTAHDAGIDSMIALCERFLARVAARTLGREASLARIEHARALFVNHALTIDAALCDLTRGELYLDWNEPVPARHYLQLALDVLKPAFPDLAWRAEYGLARCRAATRESARALHHYLEAIRAISASRSSLVTEQISNDYFAHHQSVFDQALSLATERQAHAAALEIVEASKARTFLATRTWRARRDQSDLYVSDLIARESELRYRLNALRGQLAVQMPDDLCEPFRSHEELDPITTVKMAEWNALNTDYEALVTQLRLAVHGLAGVAAPLAFSLPSFRSAVNARFGRDWAALDYYLTADSLTVVSVTPRRVRVTRHSLSRFEHWLIEQCTCPEPDVRELVYRGTLYGQPTTSPGRQYLSQIYPLLIPADLAATYLIIAPHGPLHLLPFHALMDGERYLIEKHAVLYTPNLELFAQLLTAEVRPRVTHPLVIGLTQAGETVAALPQAGCETDRIERIWPQATVVSATNATRRRMLELNASGELARFDLVHLATHAELDPDAPHRSRILLHDEPLTTMDILNLSLNARLVTLSACQTALGRNGAGDELLGLTRAFFYAGAEGLLATLWPVEDRAMPELIARCYRHYADGADAAQALRTAQLEMLRAGKPPYEWASLVLIGRP